MQIARLLDRSSDFDLGFRTGRRFLWNWLACALGAVLLTGSLVDLATAQRTPVVLERKGGVISLEPYAANIIRITMSINKAAATAAPGYGFLAKPSDVGWKLERDANGNDVFRSSRIVVQIATPDLPKYSNS